MQGNLFCTTNQSGGAVSQGVQQHAALDTTALEWSQSQATPYNIRPAHHSQAQRYPVTSTAPTSICSADPTLYALSTPHVFCRHVLLPAHSTTHAASQSELTHPPHPVSSTFCRHSWCWRACRHAPNSWITAAMVPSPAVSTSLPTAAESSCPCHLIGSRHGGPGMLYG
jgi:hypothetical protein